ncbi:MAG: hypothetical protein U0S50_07245 [Sphingopyxis sp.]|uniref:hypothetical protein n=1 Tax=Sphingopyxis sp. TaxID=1908224 RepID=UPI002AB9929F|nr:hypothetical protein [Sphingopyxis sp.]MDZ3831596.1 hypothetical protein [Sphingopyxis sp.]
MISILALGRARFVALFAWLALASMALAQSPSMAQPTVGASEFVAKRLLVDTPVQAGRLVAVKLAAYQRVALDERGEPGSGPSPAILSVGTDMPGRVTRRSAISPLRSVAIASCALVPYAARAPPSSYSI